MNLFSNKMKLIYIILIICIILIGIYYRFFYFVHNSYMYMDDCSLLLNILNRNIIALFQTLDHTQKAPPLFMAFTYILYKCFGMSEYVFRIIPFLFSITSIILFYKVSENYLKNKIAVIIALFLLCVNYNLIYYSQSFKQYSSDIFFTLLILWLFTKLDIKQITNKEAFLYSLLIGFMTLFSFPVLFIFPVFLLLKIIYNFNKDIIKKAIVLSIPFTIIALYYLILTISNPDTQQELVHMWNDIENCGFLSLNMHSNLASLKQNLIYFFGDINIKLFCVLFIFGLSIYCFSDRKKFFLFSGIFLIIIICSFAKIYPLSERVILFLLPIIILILAKNSDINFFNKYINTIISAVMFILIIFTFKNYDIEYFKYLYKIPLSYEYTAPRETIKYVLENKKPDNIFIMVQHTTLEEYYLQLYLGAQAQNNQNYKCIYFYDEDIQNKDVLSKEMAELEKGKTYWIYILFLPNFDTFRSNLLEYFNKNNVKYEEIEEYKSDNMSLIKFSLQNSKGH